MKRITTITTLGSALVLLVCLTGVWPGFSAGSESDGNRPHVLTFDGAVDCRTLVAGANRGDLFIINGKLFPAGTLPSGMATNDPTQPVNGVPPIGDWLVRGQHAFPFPPAVAPSYSSVPVDFVTQYYVFDRSRTALTAEGYGFLQGANPPTVLLSLTGGIGRFRGASGDLEGTLLGSNVTGCPNFRVTINIVPGSIRGGSNN